MEQLAKHKPVQSSYVSLLLPSGQHHQSTASTHPPSTCQQNLKLPDPTSNLFIQEEGILQDGIAITKKMSPDKEKAEEEEEELNEGVINDDGDNKGNQGKCTASHESSQEDLSSGSIAESSANNT